MIVEFPYRYWNASFGEPKKEKVSLNKAAENSH